MGSGIIRGPISHIFPINYSISSIIRAINLSNISYILALFHLNSSRIDHKRYKANRIFENRIKNCNLVSGIRQKEASMN